ncbi:MAG: nuclease-related domain-containing protein [Steroidobacteraceae bacterium]
MNPLSQLPPLTWALVVCAVALGWALSWLVRWYLRRSARKALVGAITAVALDHLTDVLVPDGMGSSFHVDFLLLTSRGVVVIDLRDVAGNVFGGDQMNEWTVMDGAHRFTFVNPQSALYDRVAAVKAFAGDTPVEGRIVFTRRARFPKGLPKWTLMIDSLRTEFPSADPALLAGVAGRSGETWEHIKRSTSPSSLAQPRPVAVT